MALTFDNSGRASRLLILPALFEKPKRAVRTAEVMPGSTYQADSFRRFRRMQRAWSPWPPKHGHHISRGRQAHFRATMFAPRWLPVSSPACPACGVMPRPR
jgi:hypothetical protein